MLIMFGALTSKTYAFKARPWELRSVNSIDTFDALGSNTKIDFKNDEILRLLPRKCDSINGFWISNKSRYFYDAVKNNRLTSPYVKKGGRYVKVGWKKVLTLLTQLLKVVTKEYGKQACNFTYSSDLSTHSLLGLKSVVNSIGLKAYNTAPTSLNADYPNNYYFTTSIVDLDKLSAMIFVGVDPRQEASTLNLRLRKTQLSGGSVAHDETSPLSIFSIGATTNPTIKQSSPSLSIKELGDIAMGRSAVCNQIIGSAVKKGSFLAQEAVEDYHFSKVKTTPDYFAKSASWGTYGKGIGLFYGDSITRRLDKGHVHEVLKVIERAAKALSTKPVSVSYLSSFANSAGAAALGLTSSNSIGNSGPLVNYSVGEANSTTGTVNISQNAFFTEGDILLPRALFVETSEMYTNVEGRNQFTNRAVDAPGHATADWAIFRALSFALNKKSNYKDKNMLLASGKSLSPSFSTSKGQVFSTAQMPNSLPSVLSSGLEGFKLSKKSLTPMIYDFYKSNTICNHSVNLNKGSQSLKLNHSNYNFL